MAQTLNFNNVPVSLLDISEVAILNNKRKNLDNFLLDTFFPRKQINTTGNILLGDIETETPIAPFVAPCVEGRIIDSQGTAKVSSINPAYLKPRDVVTPCKTYEQNLFNMLSDSKVISTNMSLQDQLIFSQIYKQQRLRESIDNRIRLMAAELLTTGKMICRSDDYPEQIIDFGRDPTANFVPLLPWSSATATPLQDINNMMTLYSDLTTTSVKYVLTTSKVWNALVKHQDFNDAFVKPIIGFAQPLQQMLAGDPMVAQFRGYLPSTTIPVWTYDASYTVKGIKKRLIPDTFFGLYGDTNGVQVTCPVEHFAAGGQPLQYFDFMWLDEGIGKLNITCESAPMLIPSNKNMFVGGTGFAV
jgi:Phage major capsid protein E